VGTKNLVQVEIVFVVGLLLLDQLVNQASQLWLSLFGNERLFENDLVDEHLHFRFRCQVQQVNFFGITGSVALDIFKDDARWVVTKQKTFELHVAATIRRFKVWRVGVAFVSTSGTERPAQSRGLPDTYRGQTKPRRKKQQRR